jgi:hypothetical protein
MKKFMFNLGYSENSSIDRKVISRPNPGFIQIVRPTRRLYPRARSKWWIRLKKIYCRKSFSQKPTLRKNLKEFNKKPNHYLIKLANITLWNIIKKTKTLLSFYSRILNYRSLNIKIYNTKLTIRQTNLGLWLISNIQLKNTMELKMKPKNILIRYNLT